MKMHALPLVITTMLVVGACSLRSTAVAGEYKTASEIEADMAVAAQGSGGDASVAKLKDSSGSIVVTEGVDAVDPANDIKRRNVWMFKIAKGGGAPDRINILMTGTHHAREWVAYRVVWDCAQFVLANRGNDAWPAGDVRFEHFKRFKEMNVKALTDNAIISFVPLVNPEGYQYSRANDRPAPNDGGGWRKNRRDVSADAKAPGEPPPPNPRENPFIGVDLNRNYPASDWGDVTVFMRVSKPVIAPGGRGGSVSTPIPGPNAKTERWTATLKEPVQGTLVWELKGSVSGDQGTTAHVKGGGTIVRSTNGDVEFVITDGNPAFAVGDSIQFSVIRLRAETTSRWRWEDVYCGKPNRNSWQVPYRPPVVEKETSAIVALSGASKFLCHIDVHSYGDTVGWVQSADTKNANLRPASGLPDSTTFMILAAQAASMMKDAGGANYAAEASPYPTSGDTLVWQYESSEKKCATYLMEVSPDGFRPANPTAEAKGVLPGQLFLIFATVDKSFTSKPTAKFRKPQPEP